MRYVMGSKERSPSVSAPLAPEAPSIIHVIPTALGRGAQIFARTLVDELGGMQKGHRLVSLFECCQDIAVDDSFSLQRGADGTGFNPWAVVRLSRALRRLHPDAVVAHGGDAFKYVALATRAPIAYCVIGNWPEEARRSGQRHLWRALVRRASVVVAVSDDVAFDCRRVLAVPEHRLVVIPNGRDAKHFRPQAKRETASHPAQSVTLLFAGHLNAGKRPDRFVELVQTLRRQGLSVTGKILGDGPLRAALDGPAAAAGIELLGWRDDVVAHYQQADILVFPSAPDGEGMPGVLIEAGLCGLPVVATNVPGVSSVVEHGQTGLIVPVDDAAELLRATAELVRQPEARSTMGSAARARCEAKFAAPVVARNWDLLLREEIAGSGRRSQRALVDERKELCGTESR